MVVLDYAEHPIGQRGRWAYDGGASMSITRGKRLKAWRAASAALTTLDCDCDRCLDVALRSAARFLADVVTDEAGDPECASAEIAESCANCRKELPEPGSAYCSLCLDGVDDGK
jgi:hypothetical protein